MDKAIEYNTKLDAFVAALNKANAPHTKYAIESGRKFDKVYREFNVQKSGHYMVDRNSWVIFGIKSWAQHNPRRTFGTLDTVDQFDWSAPSGSPIAGTDAEKQMLVREADIKAGYAKRGRPVKVTK